VSVGIFVSVSQVLVYALKNKNKSPKYCVSYKSIQNIIFVCVYQVLVTTTFYNLWFHSFRITKLTFLISSSRKSLTRTAKKTT